MRPLPSSPPPAPVHCAACHTTFFSDTQSKISRYICYCIKKSGVLQKWSWLEGIALSSSSASAACHTTFFSDTATHFLTQSKLYLLSHKKVAGGHCPLLLLLLQATSSASAACHTTFFFPAPANQLFEFYFLGNLRLSEKKTGGLKDLKILVPWSCKIIVCSSNQQTMPMTDPDFTFSLCSNCLSTISPYNS